MQKYGSDKNERSSVNYGALPSAASVPRQGKADAQSNHELDVKLRVLFHKDDKVPPGS